MASGDTLVPFTPSCNEYPSTAYATFDTRNGHPVLRFDGTTDEEAIFSAPALPSHYDGGGVMVTLQIAFASAVSGTARWQAAFERMNAASLDLDTDNFAAFQSGAVTAPSDSGVTALCQIVFTDGSQMADIAVGEAFRLKVRRDADGTSGTDNIDTDAELVSVTITEV